MKSPLIQLNDITFRRDGRTILEDINLTVDRGDFIAVTGPNGGGKTTLLRIILKLLRPDSGRVTYLGEDGTPVPSLRFGYLPQKNTVDAHFPITVQEVIASGLLTEKNMSASARDEAIEQALKDVDLTDLRDRPIGRLSGGQLQRAMLARAIVRRPSVLVLDEPLSYIDKKFEHRLYPLVEEMAQNSTVILVSHEMSHISAMAHHHLIVDHSITHCHAAHHYFEPEC